MTTASWRIVGLSGLAGLMVAGMAVAAPPAKAAPKAAAAPSTKPGAAAAAKPGAGEYEAGWQEVGDADDPASATGKKALAADRLRLAARELAEVDAKKYQATIAALTKLANGLSEPLAPAEKSADGKVWQAAKLPTPAMHFESDSETRGQKLELSSARLREVLAISQPDVDKVKKAIGEAAKQIK